MTHHSDHPDHDEHSEQENDGASLLPGGEPGVKDDHPVGTTVGTGAGATAGAVLGTAVAGPAGAVVGGIVGGIVGGGAGHGIADATGGDDHDEAIVDERDDVEAVAPPVTDGPLLEDPPIEDRPFLAEDVRPVTVEDDRPERL